MKIKRQEINNKILYIGTIEKYPDIKIINENCVEVANNLQLEIDNKEKYKNETIK